MAVTLTSDITTPYWQLSSADQGEVVTDLDYLKQQVALALATSKGSVPFDPEFGFNLTELLDKPVNFVIPNGKLGILDTLNRDVPQVKVEYIRHQLLGMSNVVFEVYLSSNLGNFVANVPITQNFANPVVMSPLSGGFGSGFQGQ